MCYPSVFFSLIVIIFSWRGDLFLLLSANATEKSKPVSACSRTFNRTGKGLSVFVRNVNTFSFFKENPVFWGQQERFRSFMVAGVI
jgi:type II secretory pathway component PulC